MANKYNRVGSGSRIEAGSEWGSRPEQGPSLDDLNKLLDEIRQENAALPLMKLSSSQSSPRSQPRRRVRLRMNRRARLGQHLSYRLTCNLTQMNIVVSYMSTIHH